MSTPSPAVLVINSRIRIPHDEFHFSYARSSGPGGQNVNKVNSKAVLRWAIHASTALPPDVRQRFLAQFPSRVNNAGEVVIASQESREQARNVALCIEKLGDMLRSVARAPKRRRRTRPSRGSIERRLQAKRARSQKKSGRRGDWPS